MAAHTVPVRTHDRTKRLTASTVFDAALYWTAMAGIYLAFGFLWYFAAKEKLFDQNGNMPAGLAKAYDGSFLASFPGQDAAWLLLGLLEAVVFLVIAASLVSGEFLPARPKPILLAGLGLSMATFALMAFAQNMIADHESVASLFTYMTGTAVIIFLVRALPPYRGRFGAAE
jgi:hypothetical protein